MELEIVDVDAKRGRPKWMPDNGVMAKAEELASKGLTKQQIAACLGISYDTLNERVKEFPEFSEAIKKGRAKAIYDVANALYQAAMAQNITAAIFWLKCQAGWKEASNPEWDEDVNFTRPSLATEIAAEKKVKSFLERVLGKKESTDQD